MNERDENNRQIKARLDALEAKLEKTRGKEEEQVSSFKQTANAHKAMSQGFRIALELAAAIIIGALIGYWLDGYFGTSPWLMLIFFVLGIFAGFFNVVRTAKQMQKDAIRSGAYARAKDLPPDDDDEN